MLDDLTPVVKDFGSEDISIYPLFDLHVGSAQFNEKAFSDWIDTVLKDDNAYVVIGGDLLDNGLKSSVTNVYEQTMRPREQKEYVTNMLEPIKEKILCGVSGNHENRSSKDSDDCILYDVFYSLGIEERFRENAVFLITRFGYGDGVERRRLAGDKRPTYCIMVTHGSGGGSCIGSGANKNEKFGMAVDNIDALITGHTHKPITFPVGKLSVDLANKKVTQKHFTCLTATSWLDYGGYPVRKLLTPSARIEQKMIICGTSKKIQVLQG